MAKYSPYKMKGHTLPGIKQSPAKKALVGKQANLPEHLKSKIEAAPGKMYDSPNKMYGKKSPSKFAGIVSALAPMAVNGIMGMMKKKKNMNQDDGSGY
tara:strand:+ start:1997 stop:2290 length:294 start_codon:yes stop_codon:yes gene_type:complete